MAQHQAAGMTTNRRLREARQLGIGNGGDLRHLLDKAAEPGAEDEGDLWPEARRRAFENVVHGLAT